ncbi:hypothetical protein C2125_16100 [Rahnella aquatilis]|nr:hypothetical protein C2125_16100 [Rahnella aquatilis]
MRSSACSPAKPKINGVGWIQSTHSNYPSSFRQLLRWLPLFTPVTYLSKLPGIHSVAALLQPE